MVTIKNLILGLALAFVAVIGFGSVGVSKAEAAYVNGYYRSDGTYVNGYYRSRPNAYTFDNYSYRTPTYSNGYGFNNSYYNFNRSYSSNWYTPSYTDYDYGYGYNYNNFNYNNFGFGY